LKQQSEHRWQGPGGGPVGDAPGLLVLPTAAGRCLARADPTDDRALVGLCSG